MDRPSAIPPSGRSIRPAEYAALTEEMTRTIASSHLFKSLDDKGRERVLQCGYVRSFAEGDELMRQGEDGKTMFLILQGKVKVETDTASGKMVLAELGPSACVGEVSVLTNSPRTATVTAQTSVSVVSFERHRIGRILNDYPKLKSLLKSIVEGRARDMVEKFVRS